MSYQKSTLGPLEETTEKRKRTDSTSNAVSTSPSWEPKRIKTDLLRAQDQLTKLEAHVTLQHITCREMEILFREERASLIEEHQRDERALSEMEERLQLILQREKELGDEYSEAVKEHNLNKIKWENDRNNFQMQVSEFKNKLIEANLKSKDQLSIMNKDKDDLLQAIKDGQQDLEMLNKEGTSQTSTSLTNQLEITGLELQQSTRKLQQELDEAKVKIAALKSALEKWQATALSAALSDSSLGSETSTVAESFDN